MKWILFVLVFCSLNAYSQEDTSRYQRYATTYGMQVPRIWASKVFRLPDTSRVNALGGALGTNPAKSELWLWNGENWSLIRGGGGSGTSYTGGLWTNIDGTQIKSDSAAMAAYFLRRKDSGVNYVTPFQLGGYVPLNGYNLQTVTDGTGNNGTTNDFFLSDGTNKLVNIYNDGGDGAISITDFLGNVGSYLTTSALHTGSIILYGNSPAHPTTISPIGTATRAISIPDASGIIPLSVKVNGTTHYSNDTGNIDLGTISAGGTGTVSTLSVTTANGISGTVANASTTPAITLNIDSTRWTSRERLTASKDSVQANVTAEVTARTAAGLTKFNKSGDSTSYVWFPNQVTPTASPANGITEFDSSGRLHVRTALGKTYSISTASITANTSVIDTLPNKSGTLAMTSDVVLKQNLVSLTTTGSTGAATFNQSTGALNIPSYSGGGSTPGLAAVTAVDSTTTRNITSTKSIAADSIVAKKNLFSYGNILAGDTVLNVLDSIVFEGTSVTAGVGVTISGQRFSTQTALAYGAIEVNYGQGGARLAKNGGDVNNMEDKISNIPVWRSTLRYIFFEFGFNDAIDTASFRTVYNKIIDTCVARSWPTNRIVLVSPGYTSTPNKYIPVVASVAIQKSTRYVDAYSAMAARGGSSLLFDALHPNNKGALVETDAIIQALAPDRLGGVIRSNSLQTEKSYINNGTTTLNGNISLNGNVVNNLVTLQGGIKVAGNSALDQQRLLLFSTGNLKYGMGVTSTPSLDIYGSTSGQLRLGAMSASDGTTFTPYVAITNGATTITNNLVASGNNTLGATSITDATIGGGTGTQQKLLLFLSGNNRLGMGYNTANNYSFDQFYMKSFAGGFRWGNMLNVTFVPEMSLFSGALSLGASTAATSAILDAPSTTRGFLPPRMTSAQRDLIDRKITSTTITNAGSGGTDGTYALTITGSFTTTPTGTYTISSGSVSNITITNSGSNIVNTPVFSFPLGGITGATATPTVTATPITALTIYCTDCTATDASTGVMQTFNGTTWKNNW